MAYIKSHSNYVLKTKHQLTKDGTVWERDMTTIGGLNQYAKGQVPIYKSGNFIITVRGGDSSPRMHNTTNWDANKDGEIWTLNSLSSTTVSNSEDEEEKIVLKQDYYDLRDFAYYGSLTDLFQGSVTDALQRFPGELCTTSSSTYTLSTSTVLDPSNITDLTETEVGDSTYKYVISNPFSINLHSEHRPNDAKTLSYFADGGWNNYEIIVSGKTYPITDCKVDFKSSGCSANTLVSEVILSSGTSETSSGFTIGVFKIFNPNPVVVYLTKTDEMVHIRPKEPFLKEFYKGCDNFQKILLNPKTTPKYNARFLVIKENDYGYYQEFENLIFPTSIGGYNLDCSSFGFSKYTKRMVELGEFYDERFSDNLYRNMTHEAITNFDWTFTRTYNDGDEEMFVEGGQRIKSALRLFAREFDEIKSYIDGIRLANTLTYDERGNMPDYLLTDALENDGWDVVSVVPYEGSEGNFSNNISSSVTPYSSSHMSDTVKNGFFVLCSDAVSNVSGLTAVSDICTYSSSGVSAYTSDSGLSSVYDSVHKTMKQAVRPYIDEESYTYQDVNNEFLRRLRINSRHIWRNKGTIDGIRMILGMFGLKDKDWVSKLGSKCKDSSDYDYKIEEFVALSKPITDEWDGAHDMYKIDWINSTKTVSYPSSSNRYISYQGLPLVYEDNNGERLLYPYFDKNEFIDGSPYFQMNGGWLSKTLESGNTKCSFQFNIDDKIVSASTNEKLYKETVKNIVQVDSLEKLLTQPMMTLSDGQVCYVSYIDPNMAIIDGKGYEISYEPLGDSFARYVSFIINNGAVKVSETTLLEGELTVYGENGNDVTYHLSDYSDGFEIKAYIKSDNSFQCKTNGMTITSFSIVNPSGYTNYYCLDKVGYAQILASQSGTTWSHGWRPLKTTDKEYLLSTITTNYTKGNNPHNGNMAYDNGSEYFKYFKQLFKYAYENDMFDERCYANYPIYKENVIKGIGFNITDEARKDSSKVRFFGKYYYKSGTTSSECEDTTSSQSGNTILSESLVSDIYGSGYTKTEQVMNTKRMKITFRLREASDKLCELKYYDTIVMNYLTHMIPSTCILEVEYTTETF